MSNTFSHCQYCHEEWLDEQLEEWGDNSCPKCGPILRLIIGELAATLNDMHEEDEDEQP